MELVQLDQTEDLYEKKEIYDIIARAVFAPTEGKIKSISEGIYRKKHARVYLLKEDEKVLAVLGLLIPSRNRIEIRHIAVAKEEERKGYGRSSIELLETLLEPDELFLETDDAAVKFYRKLGFKSKKMPDTGMGITRYFCSKKR